jgi:UDP-GlcNAc:undecaprenyl-phosphate GlcNAc-1-phosphate transferase
MVTFLTLAVEGNGALLVGFRYPLLAGLIALAVTWVLTPWVRSFAIKRGAIDDPKRDDRRVHTEPIAKLGGLPTGGRCGCHPT